MAGYNRCHVKCYIMIEEGTLNWNGKWDQKASQRR